jgi:GTP cyclohydrolase I
MAMASSAKFDKSTCKGWRRVSYGSAMDFDKIVAGVGMLVDGIGDDISREGLAGTPLRVAEMWREFLDGGRTDDGELLAQSFSVGDYRDFVVVRNIGFSSFCEHHLLPFFGKVSVAYVPRDGVVVGLSKIARVVAKYSRRLQMQERLTKQILDALTANIANDGVLVVIVARHMCMAARGVMQPGSETVTRAVSGNFSSDGGLVTDAQRLIFGADGKEF